MKVHDRKSDDPGFRIRVGHYLAKNVHTVKPIAFTAAQRDALTSGLTSFIKLGSGDAPNDFTAMRGQKHLKSFKAGDFEAYDGAV
ncbi:MAG: hypothetical protein ABI182_06100, partial [Candidatus Baltobacteraceae bacterium]